MATLVLTAVAVFGCKAKEPSTSFIRSSNQGEQLWGEIDLDAQGKVTGRLVVPLDYVSGAPTANNGKLPLCLTGIKEPDFVLGHLNCVSGGQGVSTLTTDQVHQECYSDQTVEPRPPTRPITLTNCRKAQVLGYHFDPELRIDIDLPTTPVTRH